MHAASVEFDHSFFVGNAAESDGIVIRIIFGSFDNAERCVERVTAVVQEQEGIVEVFGTVVGADDDRTLVASGCGGGIVSASFVLRGYVSRVPIITRI